MPYPHNSFPSAPDFPSSAVSGGPEFDPDLYNVWKSYLEDLTTAVSGVSDQSGDATLAADKAIKWDGTERISYSAAKVQIDSLEITGTGAAIGTLTATGDGITTGDCTIGGSGTATFGGNLTVVGVIDLPSVVSNTITIEQISEPDDPPAAEGVVWNSNGTGYGDVGDLCVKITMGVTTKSKTLVDYSTL